MVKREKVIRVFEIFNSVMLGKKYVVKKGITLDNIMNNFMEKMEGASFEIIFDYLEFQFGCRIDGNINGGFTPLWIFGNKSIDRYFKRSEQYHYMAVKKLYEYNGGCFKGIKTRMYFNKENSRLKSGLSEISITEENEKLLFFNTDVGFEYCKMNTTLFNPKSEICLECLFSDFCKKELKNKFPKIFQLRCQNSK